MPPSDNVLIWYYLYSALSGQPYKGPSASSIVRSSLAAPVIDQFRKAVFAENFMILPGLASHQLLVYINKDSFDKRDTDCEQGKPLDANYIMGPDVGKIMIDALIVVVPSPISWTVSTVARHQYDPDQPFFSLDSDYLAESGLMATKLILSCRQSFRDQFDFLTNKVMRDSCLGWILGPPGTGKSTTSLAFVSVMSSTFPGWNVTWIHLSRLGSIVCVQFKRESKFSCTIRLTHVSDDLDLILKSESSDHLVIVDGFVTSMERHQMVYLSCDSWRNVNRQKRRLVVVCSMSSRGKINIGDEMALQSENFFVYSWTLNEYLTAAESPELFARVQANLDSSYGLGNSLLTQSDLVKSKFHFAGGSCRLMFDFNTARVMEMLSFSVLSVPGSVSKYLRGEIGDLTKGVVNRLLSRYLVNGVQRVSIVSKFAAKELAMKEGPGLIKEMAIIVRSNPVMSGWLFELWVFASIQKSGLKAFNKDDGMELMWPQADIEFFDLTHDLDIPNGEKWWKPCKWNQGGYDAIITNKGGNKITLVQITAGKSHLFKLKHFYMFLVEFLKSDMAYLLEELEIVFLVPISNLHTFVIGKVEDEGALEDYKWLKGEEKEMAKVYGTYGIPK